MIAVTWRQHRAQLLVAAVLLLLLGGYLLYAGEQQTSYATGIGLTGCLAAHAGTCGTLVQGFLGRFGGVPHALTYLTALPMLGGLFWGAPLVAREVEAGTHRLAWTQSVSRGRWLATKLIGFAAAAALGGAVISLAFTWWLRTFEHLSDAGYSDVNRMGSPGFDLTGIAPVGLALFALAVGTAAGALIRRTVVAMAVTLGAYTATVMSFETFRYRFLTPLTVSGRFGAASPVHPGAYILGTGYSDAAGRAVTFNDMLAVCGTTRDGHQAGVPESCLAAKGFHLTQTYQPGGRYWPLQFIQTGILVGAAAALLAVAVWWTVRRLS